MTADALQARAVLCFTRRGYMAGFLSRCRPDAPIFAFTDKQETRQMLNLLWGVSPFRMEFDGADGEQRIHRAFKVGPRTRRAGVALAGAGGPAMSQRVRGARLALLATQPGPGPPPALVPSLFGTWC